MDLLNIIKKNYQLYLHIEKKFPTGNYGETFKLFSESNQYVLKIIPKVNIDSVKRKLEFSKFLSDSSVNVPCPINTINDELYCLGNYENEEVLYYMYEFLEGINLEDSISKTINNGGFKILGKEIAKLHNAMNNYPIEKLSDIEKWNDVDGLMVIYEDIHKDIPSEITNLYKKYRSEFDKLNLQNNQMIHNDMHMANILYHNEEKIISFIDIEECALGNKVMDLAVLIFDFPVVCSQGELVKKGITDILEGYESINPLSKTEKKSLPLLLKMLETASYINFYKYKGEPDKWLTSFFSNREDILLKDKPYIPIDWNIVIGDYIQFGRYLEEPILWRVIDKNDLNYTLWSDKILTFKSFDAAGSGTAFYTKENINLYDEERDFFNEVYNQVSDKERVEAYGSGRWATSSIRLWLNTKGEVIYLNEPKDSAVFPRNYGYNEEPGFLSGFTVTELLYMKKIKHKTLLSNRDVAKVIGGVETHQYVWDQTPKNSVLNYDNAVYEEVEDNVFLLSVKELAQVEEYGLEYRKKATIKAQEGFKTERIHRNYYDNWLRTPYPNRVSNVRNNHSTGTVCSWIVSSDEVGIAPAIILDTKSIRVFKGKGTLKSPYIID